MTAFSASKLALARSSGLMRLWLPVVSAVLIVASSCRAPAKPMPSGPRLSLDRPGIRVVLRASKSALAVGDTLTFTVTVHNATTSRVQVGTQCGPSLDVRVRSPAGTYSSALTDQFADSEIPVAFTCELGPYHFAGSQDSLVNTIRWRARIPGNHVAVAGARGSEGLLDPSEPLAISVR